MVHIKKGCDSITVVERYSLGSVIGRSAVRIPPSSFFFRVMRMREKNRSRSIFLHFTRMSTMSTQYRIGAVDFEEQLEHSLGRNATITDIWSMAVYCEEEDLKRNRRGWLDAQKNPYPM